MTVTGRDTGCTCEEFGDYVMRTIRGAVSFAPKTKFLSW